MLPPRHPLVALLPAAIVVAAVPFAFTVEGRFAVDPLEAAGWLLLAAVAGLHRPLGGASLGLGALALPGAADRLGVAPTAVLAALAALLAGTGERLAARRLLPRGRRLARPGGGRPPSRADRLETAVFVAGAALAGGALRLSLPLAPGSDAGHVTRLVAGLGALLVVAALTLPAALAARLRGREASLRDAGPALLDGAGWLVGSLLAGLAAVPGVGWSRAAPIAVVVALLAVEAARNRYLRGISDRRAGRLERLQHAHRRILAETGAGGIAQQILTECGNVLPVDWFQLEMPGPTGGRSFCAGPDGILAEGVPLPPALPPALPGIHRRTPWRIVEQPLEVDGELLATLRVWCDPRRIEAGAEELLAKLLPQMASSVLRLRLDREARLDALTQIPVRRVLDARLQAVFRRACDEGESMAVILCDVDHFKKINDTHGHAAGDLALQAVARTLDGERRDGDLCARYGGEEFTLLLERTGGEQALQIAERLRGAVADLEVVFEGVPIPLTFSAGVACFPEVHVKTASELLLLADEALYRAKSTGRNRCLLHLGRDRFRAASDLPVEEPRPVVVAPRLLG